MATLTALATNFATNERPDGLPFDNGVVLAQAIAATRMYAGYATPASHEGVSPAPEIDANTEISVSEWALIRPLFILYVEREAALYWEASRGSGVDVFGRSSGEVAADIAQAEAELSHRAFCRLIETV